MRGPHEPSFPWSACAWATCLSVIAGIALLGAGLLLIAMFH